MTSSAPKPPWLRVRLPSGEGFSRLHKAMRTGGLHTVCEEALCPNQGHCWERGHATFLILGDRCTRGCAFCNVTAHNPAPPDPDEPRRVAEAIRGLNLREIVLTSVTRDDVSDGGAAIWAETVRAVRKAAPLATVEVLVPDFGGDVAAQDAVFSAKPDVFGHNLETVPALYSKVRTRADYRRSLDLLRRATDAGLLTKTALMLGIGEEMNEVRETIRDARAAGCSILFIGQYLQPSRKHHPVIRYVEPKEFDALRDESLTLGFSVVESAPLVRSSFHSDAQSELVRSRKA